MEEFSTAVERFIKSMESGDFITNLQTIHKQVQSLNADDLIATMHTLTAMDKANSHINARTQIKGIRTACSTRAAQLILTSRDNWWLGDVLLSLTHTDYKLEDGRVIVESAVKRLG